MAWPGLVFACPDAQRAFRPHLTRLVRGPLWRAGRIRAALGRRRADWNGSWGAFTALGGGGCDVAVGTSSFGALCGGLSPGAWVDDGGSWVSLPGVIPEVTELGRVSLGVTQNRYRAIVSGESATFTAAGLTAFSPVAGAPVWAEIVSDGTDEAIFGLSASPAWNEEANLLVFQTSGASVQPGGPVETGDGGVISFDLDFGAGSYSAAWSQRQGVLPATVEVVTGL